MTEVDSPSRLGGVSKDSLKGVISPSRLPLSPLQINGRNGTTNESPRNLGSPDPDEMGGSKRSEDSLDVTPKSNNSHQELSGDKFFHGRDRARSTAVTASEAKAAVGLVSLTDDTEEDVVTQNWTSNQTDSLDVSGTETEDTEVAAEEEALPEVTLEIIERLARVEKHYEEILKRVAHEEDDMAETKGRATEFGQRMMKWKEEQETLNMQQQQVVATCIKQVVSLTSQLGGIAQPGFIDTISEQLAKGMTTEVFELRKELKATQHAFEEFKFESESKEKKRNTDFQLQLDSLKDQLERKFPARTLLAASLIPRLRNGGSKPGSAKKSRIPRLKGSPGGPGSPPTSVPPSPSPKLQAQVRPLARPGSERVPVRTPSNSSLTHTPVDRTPVERAASKGRRPSIERVTPPVNTPTPSYATPTSSSKRRNSLERTPTYSSTPVDKRNSVTGSKPPMVRSVSSVSSVPQTPARSTPTSVRATAQTPRNRASTISTPQLSEAGRPRRISLPSPSNPPVKSTAITPRVAKNHLVSPST